LRLDIIFLGFADTTKLAQPSRTQKSQKHTKEGHINEKKKVLGIDRLRIRRRHSPNRSYIDLGSKALTWRQGRQ
jgi:hypothetical protein